MRFSLPSRRPLPALLAVVALALAAFAASCGGGGATTTPEASPPATAGDAIVASPSPAASPTAAATPTPDPTVVMADGGLPILRQAYDLLLDEYIRPLAPADALAPLWQGIHAAALNDGASPPATPAFGEDREQAWARFRDAWLALLESAPSLDPTTLRQAGLQAMAESLNDCHTFYMKPVQYQFVKQTEAGKGSVGVGAELAEGPPVSVREVITGSPAAQAGVRPGDRFLEIDGVDVTYADFYGVDGRLKGDAGSRVTARVLHLDGSTDDVTMTRALVQPPNVESRVLPGGIGYLRIRAFVEGGVVADIDAAIARFEEEGAVAWIIDLRGNPGGYLDVTAVSRFVGRSPVLRAKKRDGTVDTAAESTAYPIIRPTIVLIDRTTGSVAEGFADSLQEYGVAKLVGTKTAGCAGYTQITPLPDGSSLAVTTAVNLGPVSGRVLNDQGVLPDEYAEQTPADLAAGRDPPLEQALADLASVSRTPSGAGAPP